MQLQRPFVASARPGRADVIAGPAKPFRFFRSSCGSRSRQTLLPLYALTVAGIGDGGLHGSMECGQQTVNPAVEEVVLIQQGARLLSNTAYITACMTAAAALWMAVLHLVLGSVPPHIQLMFKTASQLLSGAWVGCWVIYTALAWRSQQSNALHAGGIMLVGIIPPLVYCCTLDPSHAVLLMVIGMLTYLIRPSLARHHTRALLEAHPAAKELRKLQESSNILTRAIGMATFASGVALVWLLFAFFIDGPCPSIVDGYPSAVQVTVVLHQVVLSVWVFLTAAYAAFAKRFEMMAPYSTSRRVLVLIMLPMAYFSFKQPILACVLMYAVWFVLARVLTGGKEAYYNKHQQLVDASQQAPQGQQGLLKASS